MTYLLPDPRTPGDRAHLNDNGALLCRKPLGDGVTVTAYEVTCAFHLCEDCQRIAERGRVAEWVQRGLFEVTA